MLKPLSKTQPNGVCGGGSNGRKLFQILDEMHYMYIMIYLKTSDLFLAAELKRINIYIK